MKRDRLFRQLAPAGLVIGAVLGLAGCQKPENPNKGLSAPVEHLAGWTGATANLAPNAPAGEWPSEGRDYANTRYSPLDQITAGNVARLKVAWSFADGIPYGHEAAPLVVGSTMFVVTPYPNIA